ncbi:37761_t:CDS:2, partial [Gigaspora margarita]
AYKYVKENKRLVSCGNGSRRDSTSNESICEETSNNTIEHSSTSNEETLNNTIKHFSNYQTNYNESFIWSLVSNKSKMMIFISINMTYVVDLTWSALPSWCCMSQIFLQILTFGTE